MLNYETLLSSYDDRLTLLEYLKKVEAALADASASSFSVTKTGDATIKFVLTFEDGSTLESGEIVLQQGESVASAAIDANGHLLLTLTNGDVLDAGSMFDGNVSITGTLSAAGNTSLGGNLAVGGDLEVTGTSEFHDAAQFDSDVTISGDVSTGDLTPSNLLIPSTGSIKGASVGQQEIECELPIIEKLTGFTHSPITTTNATLEKVYVGVAKNGNKLTFVAAFNLTRTGDIQYGNVSLGYFGIPSSIGAKLYPFTGSALGDLLADVKISAVKDWNALGVEVGIAVQKFSNTQLQFVAWGCNSLDLNTKYYIRCEFTFLLGASL